MAAKSNPQRLWRKNEDFFYFKNNNHGFYFCVWNKEKDEQIKYTVDCHGARLFPFVKIPFLKNLLQTADNFPLGNSQLTAIRVICGGVEAFLWQADPGVHQRAVGSGQADPGVHQRAVGSGQILVCCPS